MMSTTTQVVVGLFQNATEAHQAVTQLRASGFTSRQIGAAFRSGQSESYGNQTASSGTTIDHDHESWWDKLKDAFRGDDRAEEDRGANAASAGYISGNYSRDQRDQYEYDFANDDFAGSLQEAGIPAQRAAYLTRSLEPGGAIVTVKDADRPQQAEQILSANGGRVRYEETGGGSNPSTEVTGVPSAGAYAATGVNTPRAETAQPLSDRASDALTTSSSTTTNQRSVDQPRTGTENAGLDRIQLFGEVLRVHKDRINRGEVRVRKDVLTENQTIEVPVTREEFVLERVPVEGNTPAPSANIGREQEIRVPLTEETVRVEKQPVIREEVSVGKRQVADVETVNESVRHEELRVDSDVDSEVTATRRGVAGEDVDDDLRRRG